MKKYNYSDVVQLVNNLKDFEDVNNYLIIHAKTIYTTAALAQLCIDLLNTMTLYCNLHDKEAKEKLNKIFLGVVNAWKN